MASVATAFVALVPSADGFEGKLKKAISPAMDKAGSDSGKTFSSGFGSSLKRLAGPLVAAFSVTAIAGFAKAGVDAALGFEKGIREVITLTGSVGADAAAEFGYFSDGVKAVSKELGIATDVLNNGLYNAISAGVPKENVFDFMTVASKASIAGVTDVNTAVDGLTTVLNAFGIEQKDVMKVSDSLFAAVQGGKTTFDELSRFMFQVGPAAASAGVGIEEVNASIATLTSAGTPTSVATTQIRAALVGLQRPSQEMDAIFQKLGYENAQLALESEGLGFALGAVVDAADGSNGKLTTLLGSVEAVQAANVIAGTGAEKFAAEMERQANSVGATDAAFAEMEKTRSLEKLTNQFNLMKLEVGTALLPKILELADKFRNDVLPNVRNVVDALKGFGAWFKENKEYIAAFAIPLGITVVGVSALAIAARVAASGGLGSFLGKLKLVTAAQWLWNSAILANPIAAIVIAVAALVAGLVWFFTQTEIGRQAWATFTEALASAWTWLWETVLKPGFEAFVGFFVSMWENGIKPVIDAIAAGFQWLWDNILFPVISATMLIFGLLAALVIWLWDAAFKPALEGIGAAFSWLYENIVQPVFAGMAAAFNWIWQNVIMPVVGFIISYFETWGKILSWLYNNIVTPIFDGIASVINWIWSDVIQPVFNWVMELFEKVGTTTEDIFGRVGTFMKETFENMVNVVRVPLNKIIGFINKVIDALNTIKVKIPDFVPIWGGKNFSLNIPRVPEIPLMAKGGYVDSATLAVIGEAGPEVVTPLKDFERMMGMSESSNSGQTVNYYAAPNKSFDAEQELLVAMQRVRLYA